MKVEIDTPDDYMGEIVGDLQQRRAVIEKTESRGIMTNITAHAPLKVCWDTLARFAASAKVARVSQWSHTGTRKHLHPMSKPLVSKSIPTRLIESL